MQIESEQRSRVRRLHQVKKLSINQIAKEEGVHHSTVSRCLNADMTVVKKEPTRGFPASLLEHRGKVKKLLAQYPNIIAPRLAEILSEDGISASVTTVRRALKNLRGKAKSQKVFSIRNVLPGEEAQVDWGETKVVIDGKRQKIYIFVLVLSYSRNLFAYITRDMKAETFMCCHSKAFDLFQGVPKKILYDNLKAVVTERFGDIIKFSKKFYDYSGHYLFEPIACHVRCPEEKGRVERQVGVIKTSFFNARNFSSFEDINDQLKIWLENRLQNKHPRNKSMTISQSFSKEILLKLPAKSFYPRRIVSCRSPKQPYARFETNLYSIPPKNCHSNLTLMVGMEDVEIYSGTEIIAIHSRSYSKGSIVEDREHIKEISRTRSKSTSTSNMRSYFVNLFPQAKLLFEKMASRDESISGAVSRLSRSLEKYGIHAVEKAFKTIEEQGFLRIDGLEMMLSQQNPNCNQDFTPMSLPKHLRELKTTHQDLTLYNTTEKNSEK